MKIKLKESDPSKVKRGHQPRRSGSGQHQDKRQKRNRTRQDQQRKSIEND